MDKRKIEILHYEPELKAKTNNKRNRVAAYCRVSTLNEEQELSFETQCAYYKKLIGTDPKRKLVGIYADHGISGLHMENRTELLRMLDDCRAGKIDTVMTKSVSRFSRNMSECQRTVEELRRLGVRIIFEKEGVDTSDPSSEFFLSILSSLAQEESNSISQNIRWSNRKNSEQGTPTRPASYGYRKKIVDGKKTKEWEIVPEEAFMVRKAFDLALEGLKYVQITKRMQELEKQRGGKTLWDYSRIRRLYQNEVYKGDVLTNKNISLDYIKKKQIKNDGQYTQFYIEDHHEPIINAEIFDHVNEMTKNGKLDSRALGTRGKHGNY